MARGMSAAQLSEWYTRRTEEKIPPAVRLLLESKVARIPPLSARRMIVLSVPHPELLDGILQHPATRPLLGRRLGAANVCIADDQVEPLQKALKGLGIDLEIT